MTRSNIEVAVVRAELHEIRQDIQELKDSNKKLEKFMYQFEGGKAWMFALLAIAATMGGILSSLGKYLFTPHG